MVAVIYYIALVGTCLSLFLVFPALVGFGTGEIEAARNLLFHSLLGTFFFSLLLMSIRGREFHLDRVNSVYLVVASWILFPFLAAFPLSDTLGLTYFDGVFEAFSAFTTTSAEGLRAPETALKTGIFLRACIQWTGGLATLMTFVLFLGPIRAGGMPKPRTSAGEAAGRTASGINRLATQLIRAWLILTIIAFSLILMSGPDAYSSAILASSAISTGGYVPPGATLVDLLGNWGMLIVALISIIGATSIFWHQMILELRFDSLRKHRESYFLIAIIVLLAAAFFITLRQISGGATAAQPATQLVESLFNATSIATTSGLESRTGMFALLSPMLVIALIGIGAGTYSTAGGVKLYRIGGMFFHSSNELSHLVYPHGVTRTGFGSQTYEAQVMKSIWTMFTAATTVIILASFLLALSGMSWQASITATLAAFSNAGPVYSPEWVQRGTAGWPSWAQMDTYQRSILGMTMLAGRLEVVAFIAVLNPYYWLQR